MWSAVQFVMFRIEYIIYVYKVYVRKKIQFLSYIPLIWSFFHVQYKRYRIKTHQISKTLSKSIPSQQTISDHLFKWRFAGGPIMARFYVLTR